MHIKIVNMTVQIINQKKALELLKANIPLSNTEVQLNEDKVEALDAFLLRKNGITIPDRLVYYDDSSINFEDDPDLEDQDLIRSSLKKV